MYITPRYHHTHTHTHTRTHSTFKTHALSLSYTKSSKGEIQRGAGGGAFLRVRGHVWLLKDKKGSRGVSGFYLGFSCFGWGVFLGGVLAASLFFFSFFCVVVLSLVGGFKLWGLGFELKLSLVDVRGCEREGGGE
ncbi:hypothetical protein QBC44DRAFT_20483 [Cladorrhinum sp. PSN332]|nr:hypothetical protein QBC44DRAFT_20483 [Cladorrhinum sp. PSN332]